MRAAASVHFYKLRSAVGSDFLGFSLRLKIPRGPPHRTGRLRLPGCSPLLSQTLLAFDEPGRSAEAGVLRGDRLCGAAHGWSRAPGFGRKRRGVKPHCPQIPAAALTVSGTCGC